MLSTKALRCAFAAAMGLAICGTAHAEDWKVTGSFGWLAVGKAYQIEKGHVYFVGEFSGTFFNDKGNDSLFDKAGVKCPAFNDLDLNNKKGKAGGYCPLMMPPVSKPTSPGNVRAIQYTARELLNIQGALGNTAGSVGQIIPSLLRPRSTGRTAQRQALRRGIADHRNLHEVARAQVGGPATIVVSAIVAGDRYGAEPLRRTRVLTVVEPLRRL